MNKISSDERSLGQVIDRKLGRRAFLRSSVAAAGTAAMGGLLLSRPNDVHADIQHGNLTPGDAAILRFLAAAEILETDAWQQYNELAGIPDAEVPGGSGSPEYAAAVAVLDADMAQYIHDNTENEMTHELFLNAYLHAHGASTVSLEPFRTLPSSKATGAQQIGRLTNLMQLTLDTSWWTRYRDPVHNPDLDPTFVFPQAIPGLAAGMFPGIPRTDDDLHPKDHLQAIANTAGFHFPSIEVGGTSLYPKLAQRATNAEVLRIILAIGPVEAMHFQTWADKAGNAPPLTDPTNGLVFPDLNSPPFGGETYQTNLIMPEPCPFHRNLPPCAIIRSTQTMGAARGAVAGLTAMGLFRGQSRGFFNFMHQLAAEADAARRGALA